MYRVGQKNFSTCFSQNFVKSLPNLIIFGKRMATTVEFCEVHLFSPQLIYVSALPGKTQMLEIVA